MLFYQERAGKIVGGRKVFELNSVEAERSGDRDVLCVPDLTAA